jgi:REP element-mobilizing transposase RayT
MENLPNRKQNRLEKFDYASPGTYFVTICANERQNVFWKNDFLSIFMQQGLANEIDYFVDSVGATIGRPQGIRLSALGQMVEETICNISAKYSGVFVDYFVVMPDHVHMLLRTGVDKHGRPMVAPTLSTIIRQFKGYVTKRAGKPVWQKLFFDHVVRNEQDYIEHIKYILENPTRWRNKQNVL